MIIQGRVAEILQSRTGTREDGTEWKAQPFVVEYFEHDTDVSPQSVMLETFDQQVYDNLQKDMVVECTITFKADHWRSKEGKEGWMQRVRLHKIRCVALPSQKRTSFMPEQAALSAAAYVPPTAATEDPDPLPF